jgi:hypothetical protein
MVLPPWLPIAKYEYPRKTYIYGMRAGEYPCPPWDLSSGSQIIEDVRDDGPVSVRLEHYQKDAELRNLEAIMQDAAIERGDETEQERLMRDLVLQTAKQRYASLVALPTTTRGDGAATGDP